MMLTRHLVVTLLFLIASAGMVLGQAGNQGVVRVLAIGNSFSEDAIENYLHELSVAAGKDIVIGNLYIGVAPLSLHWDNVLEDKAAYRYRKTDAAGKKHEAPNPRIRSARADEPGDYISVQQASPLSG